MNYDNDDDNEYDSDNEAKFGQLFHLRLQDHILVRARRNEEEMVDWTL